MAKGRKTPPPRAGKRPRTEAAKHSRRVAKPASRQRAVKTRSPKTVRRRTGPSPATGAAAANLAAAAPPLVRPEKKRTYEEALRLYERAVTALQQHDYSTAAKLLNQVIDGFPEERELHERARLYLKVCERQSASAAPPPRTAEERLNAATVAMNSASFDEALRLLKAVEKDDPDSDYAQYMLAVAHALRGRPDDALPHLKRAVQLNPENRVLARQDPDLDPLRPLAGFHEAIDAPSLPSAKRRPARGRAR